MPACLSRAGYTNFGLQLKTMMFKVNEKVRKRTKAAEKYRGGGERN
jgi:hypothetical protein